MQASTAFPLLIELVERTIVLLVVGVRFKESMSLVSRRRLSFTPPGHFRKLTAFPSVVVSFFTTERVRTSPVPPIVPVSSVKLIKFHRRLAFRLTAPLSHLKKITESKLSFKKPPSELLLRRVRITLRDLIAGLSDVGSPDLLERA